MPQIGPREWSRRRLAAPLLAAAVSLCATAGAGAATRLTISPAPGTPDASPETQISILGVSPSRIRSVELTGSESGLHRGAFHAYSGRRGASFVPSRPLQQGERVHAAIRIRGRRPISLSFTVARLAPTPPVLNLHQLQLDKLQQFRSAPGLLAPRITVLKAAPQLTGDIFLTPLPSPVVHPESDNAISINPVGPGGPMIVDSRGRLVWFRQLAPPTVATNLQVQRLGRRSVLTWWQGQVTIAAFGMGDGIVADHSYRTVKVVKAGNGYDADLHEFRLTPSGDALLDANSLVLVHLPGTPPGTTSKLLDSVVQEIDIRTGLVVWEWHALGHIPLAQSLATPSTSAYYDAYHINSIQPLSGQRVLVSARDTSAVYELDQRSGRVLWRLGGKASSFKMGRGARFYFQHDASLLPGNRVSLFDDEAGPPVFGVSRGLVLQLDFRRHTATRVRQYERPGPKTVANSEGSYQTLPGGDVFAGFGSEPFFTQFTAGGALRFDARLPRDDGSYRAFRFAWSATPRTRPALVVRRSSASQATAYVSWNGATAVARWQVLGGPAGRAVRTVPRQGFETAIPINSAARTFAVRALSSSGHILATSQEVQSQ